MRSISIITAILLLFGGSWFFFATSPKTPHAASSVTNTHSTAMALTLTSSAFGANGLIPAKYSCDGENVNPPLSWSGVPSGTKSYALIMDDPDIPDSVKQARGIEVFDHWVVYNIPVDVTSISAAAPPPGNQGLNGAGEPSYRGPCPPDGEHRYFFYLYALDTTLPSISPLTKQQVLDAMRGHILAEGQLMARYDKQR